MTSEQPPHVLAEDRAHLLRRRLAQRGFWVGEQVQGLGAGELLAAHPKTQRRFGLVEQPDPGGAPGDRFLVQDALELVGKLVRPERAHVPEPRRVVPKLGRGEFFVQNLVVDAIEFEREEQSSVSIAFTRSCVV